MINENEKNRLRKFIFSEDWKLLNHVVDEMCDAIKERGNVAETEWETARNTVASEHEVRALRNFIQRVHDLAQ